MSRGYTDAVPTPTPRRLFSVLLLVSLVVFLRPPTTNFIFDEQEALLANPYLLGDLPVGRVFHVDFWGLPRERSIGSYRPLPNLLWRPFAASLGLHTPWLLSVVNIFVHALTGTFFACTLGHLCASLSRREKAMATWLGGLFFCISALSTEAVSSVVGLSDLLVGCATAAASLLIVRMPAIASALEFWRPKVLLSLGGVLVSTFLGLLGKESMLASLPLLPLVVWFRPWRENLSVKVALSFLSGAVGLLALVAYVSLRNYTFGSEEGTFQQIVTAGPVSAMVEAFLSWLAPPTLPSDAMNNPLLLANASERIFTAGAIFIQQIGLFVFPVHLSADFSVPRQPVDSGSPVAIAGVLLFLLFLGNFLLEFSRLVRGARLNSARALAGLGSGWLALSYFPISNALVVLPTVRADRLFYTPALGGSLFLVAAYIASSKFSLRRRLQGAVLFGVFSLVQARAHALHYSNDVVFWRATSAGSTASAKSYLNYGVMVGARGNLEGRIRYTEVAAKLAPNWPMGQVYLGDAYCRNKQFEKAYLHYRRGLDLAPKTKTLTALALQCMWETGIFEHHKRELQELAAGHPDTWLDYFVDELSQQERSGVGISLKYRPRRYNERRSGGE